MSPFEITLIISVLVLAIYGIFGLVNYDPHASFDEFFLRGRSLNSTNVRNTFAGASISIATVLVFFLTIGISFGWYVLISPATLLIGILLFSRYIYPKLFGNAELKNRLQGNSDRPISSLTDFVAYSYDSKIVTVVVTLVSAFGAAAILVAEFMVGVLIYGQYFVQPEYIVLIIALSLFLYAGFGGMRSVVETDHIQVILICISIALVLVSIVFETITMGGSETPMTNLSKLFLKWPSENSMPISLIIHIFVINICLLPSSLRVWQMVAASTKSEGFSRALGQSAIIILWVVFGALLISKGVVFLTGKGSEDITIIFSFLADGNQWLSYVVYPIFVVALLSALISTADSAILPLNQLSASVLAKQRDFSVRRNLMHIVGLVAFVLAFFYLVTQVLDMDLIPWILTVFSITTCIAPVIVGPLLYEGRRLSVSGETTLIIGIIIGFAVAFYWSVRFANDLAIQPWNCVLAFSISTLSTWIAFAKMSYEADAKGSIDV